MTGAEIRHSLRSMVESVGGESGDRPRLPDRPDAQRPGCQADRRRHGRGEDQQASAAEAAAVAIGHRRFRRLDRRDEP